MHLMWYCEQAIDNCIHNWNKKSGQTLMWEFGDNPMGSYGAVIGAFVTLEWSAIGIFILPLTSNFNFHSEITEENGS